MFITAKLLLENYMPDKLEKGMWFKQRIKDVIYGRIYEYDRVFELNHTPMDEESYININGYPVQPIIMSITANPDEKAIVLAKSEQIGWWDDDPWDDSEDATLRDIQLSDINLILSDYDGELDIQVVDHMFEKDIVETVIYMDKVTLCLPIDKSYEADDDDEDDYEDWDDMDDITDYDPQDYETE